MESLTEEKSERIRVDAKWCERISSDRWRTRSDNVVSAKSKENEEEGAGFYSWSARKMKWHFDPRYELFDEWHVSCALNASAACQTFVVLTASRSISHHLNVFNTVSYKYQTVTMLIVSPSTQYSQMSPFTYVSIHHPHEHWTVDITLTVTLIGPLAQKAMDQMGWRGQLKKIKIEGKAWWA